jgi:hypothetical protein
MALSHSPSIIAQNLSLCLDAANPKSYSGSGTTWTDLSGNGNNGTLVNGVGYNSGNLGSLSFDGVDDLVDTNKTPLELGIYDSSYTLNAFFKLDNLVGDNMIFGTTQTSLRMGMHHGVRNSTFYFGHFQSDTNGGTASANKWYYGSWVWSNSSPNALIYIDGALVASSSSVGSFLGTTNLLLGSWRSVNFLTGNISQVSIYNRALTAQEIQQNFNATKSRYI